MSWAPNYVTLNDLKSHLRIQLGDTTDDSLLELCRESAARCIDEESRRQFGQVDSAETRSYEYAPYLLDAPRYRRYMWFWIDDLQDPTDMVVMRDATDVTDDAVLYPLNALAKNRPYTELRLPYGSCNITVTATWGWLAIPDGIINATRILASRFYTRRDAPFGVLGSPEIGNQFRIPANDGDVRTAIKPYYRWV